MLPVALKLSRAGWRNLQRIPFLLQACLLILGCGLGVPQVIAAEPATHSEPVTHFDVFNTRSSGTYSNVTVQRLTATHVTVRSEQGAVVVVKLSDLDETTVAKLKGEYQEEEAKPVLPLNSVVPKIQTLEQQSDRIKALEEEFHKRVPPEKMVLVLVVGGAIWLAFYLFYCFCLMLICKKTGNEPGILVWLPFFQIFPLFRSAGMSYWWILALFVPVLNFVAWIVWCLKIAEARGKSVLTAILLMLPITNLFAFLYLAFSSGVDRSDEMAPPRPA